MLLSALDPALLFYDPEDWEHRQAHCFARFGALSLHIQMTKDYRQKIAMSDEFEWLLMSQKFPWDEKSKNIPEVRDLRQLMYNDLLRVEQRINIEEAVDIDLRPEGILCECIERQEIIDLWEKLLCGCISEITEFEPQVASWVTSAISPYRSICLTICSTGTQHELPLVWDEDSWFTQLTGQNWWPNLQRCVEFESKINPSIRDYASVRKQPISFECTKEFQHSLDELCTDDSYRRSLVEALTKKVYGVHVGLNDKQIRGSNMRRFRVTDFWRVHYCMEGERIVLLRFGPHRMDGIG